MTSLFSVSFILEGITNNVKCTKNLHMNFLVHHSSFFTITDIDEELERFLKTKFFVYNIMYYNEDFKNIQIDSFKQKNEMVNSITIKNIKFKLNQNEKSNKIIELCYNPVEPTKIILWLDGDNNQCELIDEPFVHNKIKSVEFYDGYFY